MGLRAQEDVEKWVYSQVGLKNNKKVFAENLVKSDQVLINHFDQRSQHSFDTKNDFI